MSTPTIIPERLDALRSMTLASGPHAAPAVPGEACAMCAMEAAAWVAGRVWSDSDESICPVVAAASRVLNDRIRDDGLRTELLLSSPSVDQSITVRAVGSRGSQALTEARGWMAVFAWSDTDAGTAGYWYGGADTEVSGEAPTESEALAAAFAALEARYPEASYAAKAVAAINA